MGNSVKFKVNRCPNCNANVLIDPSKERAACEYCGSVLSVVKPQDAPSGAAKQNAAQHTTTPTLAPCPPPKFDRKKIPPRPRINFLLLILGFCFYFIPGILYLMNVLNRQNQWDKKYYGY